MQGLVPLGHVNRGGACGRHGDEARQPWRNLQSHYANVEGARERWCAYRYVKDMPPVIDPVCIDFAGAAGEAAIKQLCQRVLPGWQSALEADMQLSKISGGISNLLVKVSPGPATGLWPVAVKVFGDKTELLIDRAAELQVLVTLNQAGFGAQVLAVFENGRIEEFLTATTLTPADMAHPTYVPRIARILRRLHGVTTGGQQPQLFEGIRAWLHTARGLSFPDASKQARFQQLDMDAMGAELDQLQQLTDAVASPVVFSHNDLLSGNILVLQRDGVDISDPRQVDPQGPLQLIDFEYSGPGFRGFDWGNHFNEYAGFDCDYSRYPDRAAQALFFGHYMAEDAAVKKMGQPPGAESQDVPVVHSDAQLDKLCAEADLFALVSHTFWGIWALVQARYSPIDFDYLEYSAMRWREYHRRKPDAFTAAKQAFLPAALMPDAGSGAGGTSAVL